ncbi:DUF4302 domain-containing protein [Mariniflexile maritimum]|uniref:DUF4302 domain-containing protein n=1 Tax=Mariniflexile maritimum TaxID=2682493 RepID=UPI0012F66538|nr:DUF4302 domain-containing protein [Mariniflexile maritimum]
MKNIYLKFGLICLLFFGLVSCNNDTTESLFSDSPADRIAQKNSELLNLLLKENNGFKGVYFPKNDEFGGFTFYMKFNADGTVNMTSDFDAETAIETSSYEVRYGATTELVFTTRNHIQKVSNPDLPGLIGTGFKGTSVFQYFGNANGVITLKDVRNSETGRFELTPSGLANFNTESVQKVQSSLAQRQNILPKPTSSVFQVLKIKKGNKESNFNFNYDAFRLYASPRVLVEGDVLSIKEFNFGIAFTGDGLMISPSLEFDGESYTNFTYNAATSSYVSTVNGSTATILFDAEPAFISEDVNELLELGPTGFLYQPGLGSNPLTSLGHDNVLKQITTNFQTTGYGTWTVRQYQLIIDFESDNCDTYLYIQLVRAADGARFNSFFCFERGVITNRKLFLKYSGPTAGNSVIFEPLVMPLLNFFKSSKGLIYTDEGSFSSSAASYINRAGTFTSLDNPSIRVYGLWFG